MQIDALQLSHPASSPVQIQSELLIDHSYTIVAKAIGPLRALVTIASRVFPYRYIDPLSPKSAPVTVTLECRLYRALAIYHDDAIVEKVYVRGTTADGHSADLFFVARYFTYMDLGREACVTHHRHIPDWLSIGCGYPPSHGYAFSTDVHATPVASPHPGFPRDGADRTFSWMLEPSDQATCLHMFKIETHPELLAHESGRAWYYRIYHPLQGTIVRTGGSE